jgi:hypothetical protein
MHTIIMVHAYHHHGACIPSSWCMHTIIMVHAYRHHGACIPSSWCMHTIIMVHAYHHHGACISSPTIFLHIHIFLRQIRKQASSCDHLCVCVLPHTCLHSANVSCAQSREASSVALVFDVLCICMQGGHTARDHATAAGQDNIIQLLAVSCTTCAKP